MDSSGDGSLSYQEFCDMLNKPEMILWMSALEIDPSDVDTLFNLMADEGNMEISFDQFLAGAGQLKGQASSMSIAKMARDIKMISHKVHTI